METSIQIFENAQFGQIRTIIGENHKPLFVGNDVAKALGYSNPRKALSDHCKGVTKRDTPTNSGIQSVSYIPESDIYRLIMRSKLPQAEQFQDWVFEEVLPSIRKSGGYIASKETDTPEIIMARALLVAKDTIDRQKRRADEAERKAVLLQAQTEAQAKRINDQDEMLESRAKENKRLRPYATFAHAVQTSEHSILVGELARIIKQNGVEIGQNRLFEYLREHGFLIRRLGESYNQPTQRAMDAGLFEMKKTIITKPDGTSLVNTTPKVTGKGQVYFVNRFLYDTINAEKIAEQKAKKGGQA